MAKGIPVRAAAPKRALSPEDEIVASISRSPIGHRRMAEVYDLVDLYLSPGVDAQFVILIGPAGIGKTTLLKSILKDKIDTVDAEHRDHLIPAIMVRADSAQGEDFPFVNLYEDALNELKERGIKSTGEFIKQTILGNVVSTFVPTALRVGKVAMRYKNRTREAMNYRGTETFILDEASHLITGAKGDAQVVGDELKTLIDEIDGAKLLLSGSYELFQIKLVSAQLVRRTKVVFFLPYETGNDVDVKAFGSIVATSLANVPFKHRVNVTEDFVRFVMAATMGVTGLWIKTLVDATLEHLKLHVPFEEKLLFRCLPDSVDKQIIEREIAIIRRLEAKDLDGAMALGFADFYRAQPKAAASRTRTNGKRGRVGKRNLGRDALAQ